MNAVYEEDFLGYSYGFRPGRSPHDALDALAAGIYKKKVNWLQELHGRVQRGTYRASPSRRAYILKSDGRKRPLGIATLVGRPSMLVIGSVSSRPGPDCWCRSSRSWRALTGSSAAGPGSSGSGTRPECSTRSGRSLFRDSASSLATFTGSLAVGDCASYSVTQNGSVSSTSTDSSSHPGRTLPGGPSLPDTVGEGRR